MPSAQRLGSEQQFGTVWHMQPCYLYCYKERGTRYTSYNSTDTLYSFSICAAAMGEGLRPPDELQECSSHNHIRSAVPCTTKPPMYRTEKPLICTPGGRGPGVGRGPLPSSGPVSCDMHGLCEPRKPRANTVRQGGAHRLRGGRRRLDLLGWRVRLRRREDCARARPRARAREGQHVANAAGERGRLRRGHRRRRLQALGAEQQELLEQRQAQRQHLLRQRHQALDALGLRATTRVGGAEVCVMQTHWTDSANTPHASTSGSLPVSPFPADSHTRYRAHTTQVAPGGGRDQGPSTSSTQALTAGQYAWSKATQGALQAARTAASASSGYVFSTVMTAAASIT